MTNTYDIKTVLNKFLREPADYEKVDHLREVLIVTNGDSRQSANKTCWHIQEKYQKLLQEVLKKKFSKVAVFKHGFTTEKRHGFTASQREGIEMFRRIDPQAPVIVLLTSWQFSHHLASSLTTHEGPILILANFDGTYPGLVGALNMAGTLTSLGRKYSRLWSQNFDDDFFLEKLSEWLNTGEIIHDVSHLTEINQNTELLKSDAGKLGKILGSKILKNKELMGLFDSFCMGMINGVFPQKSLCDIGIPMESYSQTSLLLEMEKVPQDLKEKCLQYYIDKGMTFKFGTQAENELTREQVLEQCAMLIAMARIADRDGLTSIGVQYQLGLAQNCAASDFAEGAIGSSDRFPIPNENGEIIRPGKPIPCINEVDMGTAIPQTMLFRLLDTLGLPSETTLHDVRWGSDFGETFYWDFEISGNVPFEHIKGGIAGATGYRQPPMYFAKGGSTISGQCKAGAFIWSRAHYEGTDVHLHIGTGTAIELPEKEFKRRLKSTTSVWPLMNVTLDGVSRDQFMAAHQSNHITVAYVPKERQKEVTIALIGMAITQGMNTYLCGAREILK